VTLAILCAGQGDQHPAMFDLTAGEPRAAPVFAAASRHFDGRDPRDVVADDGVDIHANRIAQLLCTTATLATWAMLSAKIGDRVRVVAGYSVGEVAAWHVAGAMDAETTLALVDRRATLMDEASRGKAGLLAVSGLSRSAVDRLIQEAGVHLAIRNADDRVILGGAAAQIDRAAELAERAGAAGVSPIPVEVASHTPLLSQAATRFAKALAEADGIQDPPLRLLSGVDGEPVFTARSGLAKLGRQIAQTVDWAACLENIAAAGVERALDLGPGRAMARMMAERLDQRHSRSIEDFRSLSAVVKWVTD
jgi:[acyl-carrier-protein] S-malonyltransferase